LTVDPLPLAPYTQSDLFDPEKKDPINLAYAGALADLREVLRLTTELLDCTATAFVGDQVFAEPLDPIARHRQDFNQATQMFAGFGGRYHTRIYQMVTAHPILGRLIASPVHQEAWDWLPLDAATSFDLARDWAVTLLLQSGEREALMVPLSWFGPIKQWNGRWVTTDGSAAVVAELGFFGALGLTEGVLHDRDLPLHSVEGQGPPR